jgi:hypothetical protein
MNAPDDILEYWLENQRIKVLGLTLARIEELSRMVARDRESETGENTPLDDN